MVQSQLGSQVIYSGLIGPGLYTRGSSHFKSRVEAFAIGLNQAIEALFGDWLSDQGDLRAANIIKSGMCSFNLTFNPSKIKW